MRIIKILPSFERSLKSLSVEDKDKLKKSLIRFNEFLVSGTMPVGLGFKKINHDKYELRVDMRLRVIIKMEKEYVYSPRHQNPAFKGGDYRVCRLGISRANTPAQGAGIYGRLYLVLVGSHDDIKRYLRDYR